MPPVAPATDSNASTRGTPAADMVAKVLAKRAMADLCRSIPIMGSFSRARSRKVVQMVAIGEESGAIDKMLNRVADFYEEEVDNLVDNLSSLMEPFIMVILGILLYLQ
jgi:transcriptional regulator GlxA family with amidase domain